ncbi:hypothetical protein KKG81_08515 [bacterium]|nr:hypothetical protein [bacterium]
MIFKIKSYEPGKFHHQMQKYEGIIKSHKYKGSKLFYNVQIGSLLFLVSPRSVIEKKKSKNIWPKVPWGQYTNLSN